MKKIFLGLLAAMVSMTLFAERVAPDDAALVANNFMNVASASAARKAAPQKKMVRKATAEENMFYIYENANGEGWVIIAGDDALTPVLAYSETGTFRTENMPVNVKSWLGKYNKFVRKIEDEGVVATEEATEQWKALRRGVRKAKGDAVVGPLITTKWDQDSPYYDLCPGTGTNKAYTGCVATAMAQVMNYWEWPVKGTGSHSYQPLDPNSETGAKSKRYGVQSADFGSTTYDWANMLDSYTSSATAAQKTAVATLMYHCGVATEMMYGNDADGGSGTYTVNYGDWETNAFPCAQNAFHEFFGYKKDGLTGYMRDGSTYEGVTYYKKWSDSEWTTMVKEELDKKHPIMYGGADYNEQGECIRGHSFIFDGYDNADYFHFNWGWSGSNDGYYKLSNLQPGGGGAGGGSYDFSDDQDVIIGIVPDKQDMPEVTITWSVNGETTETVFHEEDALVLPDDPVSCAADVEFVGWTTKSELNGEKPEDLFKVAAGKIVSAAVTYYAVFANVEGEGGVAVEDQLTLATTGVSGNTYAIWSGKTVNSPAVYAGNTAGGNSSIQLRSKNGNSGLFTTASGGKLSKVIVDFNENTADGRQLDIYGKDEPYSDASDLFNSSKGTKIGSIVYGTTTELEVDGEYTYVGVRSNNGAIYLNSITFVWGGGATYSNYTTNCSGDQTSVVNAAADQSLATKVVRDGQIVIIRGNEVFNLLGVRLN